MERSAIALLGLALALLSRPAHAFSDPTLFAAPAAEGGGNGRYFTGSPVDGLACGVCHQGGEAPAVSITGLPSELEPRRRYEVGIVWDNAVASHALQLELVDSQGAQPDTELLALGALPSTSRCEGDESGEPAVYLTSVGLRRIVGVQDCGASELRFAFTAPDSSPLYFALGMVASDGSATASGDGVLELRTSLDQVGQAASFSGGACSFSGAPPSAAPFFLFGLLGFGLWSRRRSGSARHLASFEERQ